MDFRLSLDRMRLAGKTPLPALLAPVALLLLAACGPGNRVAGDGDLPAPVEALGKSAAAEARDSSEWNAYKEPAAVTGLGLDDTTHVPDTIPADYGGGLLKRGLSSAGAAECEVVPAREAYCAAFRTLDTLIDTVSGLIRVARIQGTTSFQARDTTWYRLDSSEGILLSRVAGVIERTAGRTERFAFEDGDGDGILSARAGSSNIAAIRRSWSSGDSGGESLRRVAAGADRNFNLRADNILLAHEEIARAANDTVLRLLLRDADGDSSIFSPLRDTSLVDVERVTRPAGSSGARLSLYYRLAVFTDPARNRPVRFRRVLETGAGVTETVALGRDSLPDFAPGDTGRVRVTFTSSVPADTLESAVLDYRILLSDTAGRFTGNRLLRVDAERAFRFGAASGARCRLIPGAPVPDGSFARAGRMELRVDLRAGGWIEFAGDAGLPGLSGTYAQSGGKSGAVHFDAAGNVIAAPASP